MPRQPHHSSNYGGARPGAGRNFAPDKYSRDLVKKAHEDGIHPFEYLIAVVRDKEADKKDRMYCATALMPYCAQRLQHTEIKVTNELDNLSLSEKVALAATLRASITEQRPDMTLPRLPVIEGQVVNVTD
jgi:hypothetical protein